MDAKLASLLVAGLLQGTPALARTAECTANSPNHTVAVLELFTSEGCNSCPPADRWLSSLRDAPGNTGKLIPLALHVDYWDYIGWKDPFARPAFAERQREMSLQAGSKVVYTPQFFIQGRPYKASATTPALASEVTALNQRPPGADIALSLAPAADGKLKVRVDARLRPDAVAEGAELVVVLYENDLSHAVKAGENRGVTLHHDFVVRDWVGPLRLPANGHLTQTIPLAVPADSQPARLGVAAFVQGTRSRTVLQAVARDNCS